MAHILRIDEIASLKQFGVRDYMNANNPNFIMFNNGMKPFLYGGVWFYPVASRPARKTFNAIDKLIEYDNWCKDFSNSLHYDWNDFYKEAKEQGYAKCDVFACRLDGKIHYFIPTGRMLAHFPMYNAFKHSSRDMKLLENELNNIFDSVEM